MPRKHGRNSQTVAAPAPAPRRGLGRGLERGAQETTLCAFNVRVPGWGYRLCARPATRVIRTGGGSARPACEGHSDGA